MFKSIAIIEGGLQNSKIWWFERFRQLTDNIILVQPYEVTWEKDYIDQFYVCDYTDWDVESVRIAGVLSDEGVEVIFPLCEGATKYGNDLRNLLGFPKITAIDAGYYTNKQRMRRYCRSKGIRQPMTSLAEGHDDTEVMSLSYPLVVKPAEMMGSLGVRMVSNQTELAEAITLAKTVDFPGEDLRGRYGASDKVLVEEFIVGKEYSVECIVVNGTPIASMITEKFKSNLPYFDEIGHIANPVLGEDLETKIVQFTSRLVEAMRFCNGICHIEIISNVNGIYLVEIAARPAGCWIPYLHMLGGHFDIVRVVLMALSATQIHPEFDRKKDSAGVFFPFVTNANKDASKRLMANLPKPPQGISVHREAIYTTTDDAFIVPGNVTDRLGMMIVIGDYESIRMYFEILSNYCVNYYDREPAGLLF